MTENRTGYLREVHGVIALRPGTQDRQRETALDARRNLYTGQVERAMLDDEDD